MSNQALAGNILAVIAIIISLIVAAVVLIALALAGRESYHFMYRFGM